MMRSLWTSASGMTSQQLNVDTIANNLANVNTTGFKRERLEFQSLLYETMRRADLDAANPVSRPVNLQVGHGVRPIAVSRSFTPGNLMLTENPLDFALQGPGFLQVAMPDGEVGFTRDGSFKMSVNEDGSFSLVTSAGLMLLSTEGGAITIPSMVRVNDIFVNDSGDLGILNADGTITDLGVTIGIVQFTNDQGLLAIGSNLFAESPASGPPINEWDGEIIRRTTLLQGSLEMSNVQVAQEMVDLIVAQRAYELNSRVIQASDDMLSQANNLRRG
ncbi:MAG: flagellar basal-body rod protein FlgG [Defluviitaleaceae bacterium]|nr:flagellar basal-body rod protein FlgG [Defluviitaleaceae bacterium]